MRHTDTPSRSRGARVAALLCAALLAACNPSTPAPPPPAEPEVAAVPVRRPGVVLVDPERRTAELRANRDLAWLCGARPNWSVEFGDPVVTVRPSSDNGIEPFTLAAMTAAANHIARPQNRPLLIDRLLGWASAGALTEHGGDATNAVYTAARAALPLIASYAAVRGAPGVTDAERAAIDAWLGRVVGRLAIATGPIASRNNHRLLRDSAHMAYGALTGDAGEFGVGMAGYRRGLREARPDGGLPLELGRGNRALFYQRHAIASLVAMAEMAAAQGHDLYGVAENGVDLHDIVAFLLDGLDEAAGRVPAGQARTGLGRQDLSFLERRPTGRHYMAWAEAYVARFPDHPNGRRLRSLLAAGAQRPLTDDYLGGNASCLFARS
ncbi:MAG TPA: alginate lyase family protein [Alphaproteobacteria bacterium]|nr:alginate lyase family protein [Alphaproteobacteria bacterium]